MGAWSALLLAAPQGLAVNGDAFGLLCGGRIGSHDRFRPLAQLGLELCAIQVAEDPMQRTRTGGLAVRESQRRHQPPTVVAAPLGDGTITAVATQHRRTDQRQNGRQRITFARRLPKVDNLDKSRIKWIISAGMYHLARDRLSSTR